VAAHSLSYNSIECVAQMDLYLMDSENAAICDQLSNGLRLEALSTMFSLYCQKDLAMQIPDFLKFATLVMQ